MAYKYVISLHCTRRRTGVRASGRLYLIASSAVVLALMVLRASCDLQAAASPVFQVPMRSYLNGRHIDQPVVETRIAGAQALLMLDSGADTTVLDESLIQPWMRLKKSPEASTGSATLRMAENVPLKIGNYSLTLSVVALSKLAERLVHDYGIKGILSAQAVLQNAALLFDFQHNAILGFATTEDLRAWLQNHGSAMSVLRVPIRNAEGELYVEVALAGHAPTWLMLDTGGGHTYFPRSAVGPLNAAEVRTYSEFDGRSRRYFVVPNQSIVFAGHSFGPMAVTTGADVKGGATEEEGRLGVDFLRRFAVAFPRGKPKEIWLVMHK